MREALVIARREIGERSRFLLLSAIVATLPFLAALLPTSRGHRLEVIAILGGFLAAALGFGVAVALGATVVGTEQAQRRMSFYFSKPLSASSLWIGKLLASLAISVTAFLLVALPVWLSLPGEWAKQWTVTTAFPWQVPVAIAVLFLVSHAIASMLRSRSAVLGIDFVLLTVTVGALALLGQPLIAGGAMRIAGTLGLTFACAFVLILTVAPVWQLDRGRVDVRRGHAAFSRFVWTAVGVVLLALGAYVIWFVSVTPADLDEVETAVTINPEWAFVGGTFDHRGDYTASFLVHGESGKYERLDSGGWGLRSSGDGSTVALARPVSLLPDGRELELVVWKLEGSKARKIETGIRFAWPFAFGLSRDGSRVALIHDGHLSVQELASGRILAVAPWNKKKNTAEWVTFRSNDLVRVFEQPGGGPVAIYELDIPSRALRLTGQAPEPQGGSVSRLTGSADGTRLLPRCGRVVFDARTGAKLAEIPVPRPENGPSCNVAMLNDGSVVAVVREGGGTELRQFDRAGFLMRTIPLRGAFGGIVAGEVEGGKVLVNVRNGEGIRDSVARQTLVVDLETAKVVRRMDQLYTPWWYPADGEARLPVYAPDSWIVSFDRDRHAVSWNLATGRRR